MTKLNDIAGTVRESDYARVFDETNPRWEKTPEYNLLFLKNVQNYMNDLLHVRGHVLLNDVYDQLGFKRTSAGAVVGWIMTDNRDSYIAFEIQDHLKENPPSIQLNFNVDGVMYDKID
jgi:hypothetical protein